MADTVSLRSSVTAKSRYLEFLRGEMHASDVQKKTWVSTWEIYCYLCVYKQIYIYIYIYIYCILDVCTCIVGVGTSILGVWTCIEMSGLDF